MPVSVYAEVSSEEEQEDEEDDFGPLSWRAKQRTKRSGGYLDAGREHKRMRSLNNLSSRPSRTDRCACAYPLTEWWHQNSPQSPDASLSIQEIATPYVAKIMCGSTLLFFAGVASSGRTAVRRRE